MKSSTDAMKDSRIPDFLTSVGSFGFWQREITISEFKFVFPHFNCILTCFSTCSLMRFNTEEWILKNSVQLL